MFFVSEAGIPCHPERRSFDSLHPIRMTCPSAEKRKVNSISEKGYSPISVYTVIIRKYDKFFHEIPAQMPFTLLKPEKKSVILAWSMHFYAKNTLESNERI